MPERSRATKTLLGCGLGCGVALVALIAAGFTFNAWLKSPGEVLDPVAMLDPRVTTYVACRLDLAEAPTRELVEQVLAATQRPAAQRLDTSGSPLLQFLARWNQDNQRRDLTRLFPVTAAWVVWPGEQGGSGAGAVTVSARGMSHMLVFMDWMLGFVAGRGDGRPTREVAGERVYEIGLENGEPVFAFLDALGAVVCFDLDSVAPAVERLREGRVRAPRAQPPGELERRLAAVPDDLPLRGAVLGAEVGRLLGWLAPGVEDAGTWDGIEAATLAGRFTGGGVVALTLELALDPATTGDRRERLLGDLQRHLAEQWGEGKATVRPSGGDLTVDLVVDELPRRLEALQERRFSSRPTRRPAPAK